MNTVIIGSGCAGLNAADTLFDLGERDIIIVTEDMYGGTSRNTGSDKQTYYKLSLAGSSPDSPELMAQSMMSEGVNGDNALAEAACSAQCFYKLVALGVPFPHNEYGEFAGYQTDHSTAMRATSAGPLTSKYMTEALHASITRKNIKVADRTLAYKLIVTDNKIRGVLCYDVDKRRVHQYECANVILATGGPANVYEASVYPTSQTGMTGMAIEAGALCANLHQWQYGLASTKFRWNVSGSYQQALPRYISIDRDGVTREFLLDSLPPEKAIEYTFLKGYEWPFDVKKVDGSSRIDMLVHAETSKGRRVYLDYTTNPTGLAHDFNILTNESRTYLRNCDALADTPIERLRRINAPAIELYKSHGIDITSEPLEVAVCAQHMNGGVAVDSNWQTSVEGLYAVGEAAGTFGAYRPGGSALNSTQAGSLMAARHINNAELRDDMPQVEQSLAATLPPIINTQRLREFKARMSEFGAHIRDTKELARLAGDIRQTISEHQVSERVAGDFYIDDLSDDPSLVYESLKARDTMNTMLAVIDAMLFSAEYYGSTGAGLVSLGGSFAPHTGKPSRVIHTSYNNGTFVTKASEPRPIPARDLWFENVWRRYRGRGR